MERLQFGDFIEIPENTLEHQTKALIKLLEDVPTWGLNGLTLDDFRTEVIIRPALNRDGYFGHTIALKLTREGV